MSKRSWILVAAAAAAVAGYAYAQYPIMDAVANKVIQKYQSASCEQLWQQKGQRGLKIQPEMIAGHLQMGEIEAEPQPQSLFQMKDRDEPLQMLPRKTFLRSISLTTMNPNSGRATAPER